MAKIETIDGNQAAAYASYAFTEVAAIYPITPSSPMAEGVDEWSAHGMKNIFGQQVRVVEMQSEAGAAGAMHGSLAAGALSTTYTASQGLLLMVPNLYKMSGELLPGVLHVSARAIATHALSIFGDHQDVMACRQTGAAMLASSNVQEVADLAFIAHLSAIKSRIPFIHFFDGFRTSHEYQKVELIEYDELKEIIDYEAIKEFRSRALSPEHPVVRGTAQNPDIYFQGREVQNSFFDNVPDTVSAYMHGIKTISGREYRPFNYYGASDAEYVVIAMGSVCDTIDETIDYLTGRGEKVGAVRVHLYRPFSAKYFFDVIPQAVKRIAVLDRTKEPGAPGEPLYLDVTKIYDMQEKFRPAGRPGIVGGRYGLGSKDTRPSQIMAVYENLKRDIPKDNFTIGIVDDLTNLSLPETEAAETTPQGTISCKFWGLGSDGTVGANKSAIKIIGDNTNLYVQGYFSYDSKKSGGTTISHLRFGPVPLRSTYLVYKADYIACHNKAFIYNYDILKGLKRDGTFVLNCPWNKNELHEYLPAAVKRYIYENRIKIYIIDAVAIASEIGLGNRINMIMQAAFFKLAEIIPVEDAVKYLKDSIEKLYGKKGQKIVEMNNAAVDKGIEALIRVDLDETWRNAASEDKGMPGAEHTGGIPAKAEFAGGMPANKKFADEMPADRSQENRGQVVKVDRNTKDFPIKEEPEFIKRIQRKMARHEGDELPVSAFAGMEDGSYPLGTTAYEKRGIAVMLPEWQIDKCIQCGQCSYICPHATIRPFLLNDEELKKSPHTFRTKKASGKGLEHLQFRIQVAPLDCTGCSNCADICPAKGKALIMKPAAQEIEAESENWEYALSIKAKVDLIDNKTVKGSQFVRPLLEFNGACPGCGETPYIKLLTQLFGDRMMIANATGCSSIWGASAPSIAYTTNAEGKGPAWANSLFEDNAEYGYGMYLGVKQIRDKLTELMEEALKSDISDKVKDAFRKWLDERDDGDGSKAATKQVVEVLNYYDYRGNKIIEEIMGKKDYLVKRSFWIIGGDGWAYDIGFGGLDQVISMGDDVNLFVMDTEIYSNTGGQASKSTPTASVAKFAAAGKKMRKKDLGLMAISYGHVYVAQIAMGANMNHTIKSIIEAESYKGPSLIIAYSPCVSHGIKTGMGTSILEEKRAVEAGYWHLYRYNPVLAGQWKNPFLLDSKEPSTPFKEFIHGEIRYSQLMNVFPDIAGEMFDTAEKHARERYDNYKRLANHETQMH